MGELDGKPDHRFDLYKLEYETAASRYQEIYRSMWTIFSYLTAISAAMLAFGSANVQRSALIATSLLPLLFWYWTTYLPLDRYGNNVAVRLRKIEEILNREFGVELGHFGHLAGRRVEDSPGVWGSWWRSKEVRPQLRRARFRIGVFMLLVHIGFGWGVWAFWSSGEPYFRTPEVRAAISRTDA
jgi:hypothetical protein